MASPMTRKSTTTADTMLSRLCHSEWPNVTQYAAAAPASSRQMTTTNAGSSRAHWFLVCFWYDVCR
jgi:hypothetical protein